MGDLAHTGIAVIGSAGCLSLLATTSVFAYIAVQCVGDLRAGRSKPRRSGGLTFVTSDVGAIYLSLLAGDTVQAIGFVLSLRHINGSPANLSSDASCAAQGAFIQAGDLSIGTSSSCLGVV